MGLDMYIFKEKKHKVPALVRKIQKAVEADTCGEASIGGSHLITLDENEMNHVDKLNPAISWVKEYDIHNWFSEHILENDTDGEEKQLGFVTQEQLLAFVDWCRTQQQGLCLLKADDAYTYFELKRTREEIQKLIDTTDFSKTVILYFAYW